MLWHFQPGTMSWKQFLRGYWALYRLPPDSVFLKMAAPPGWRKDPVLSIHGCCLYLVYPLSENVVEARDRIL